MYSRHFYFRYYSDTYCINFLYDLEPFAKYCWFSVPHFDRTKGKYYRYVLFTTPSLARSSSFPSFEVKCLGFLRYSFLFEFCGPFTFFDLSFLDFAEL